MADEATTLSHQIGRTTSRQSQRIIQVQINHFAGNVFEMTGREGRVLALSQTAFDALIPAQIAFIERSARLVPVAIPTLETAGGSVRCMIAGIHLSRRSKEG